MKKVLTAIAAAAALVLATVAVPQHAEARHGGAVAAGIIGGLAVGAIIGSAASHGGYYYGAPAYYAPRPYYYYEPDCYWRGERVWYHHRWHYRRVRVCH